MIEDEEKETMDFEDVKDMRNFEFKITVEKDVFCFQFNLASIYPQLAPRVLLKNFEDLKGKFDENMIDKTGKLILPLLNKKWRSFYDLNDILQEIRTIFLKQQTPFKMRNKNNLHHGIGKSFLIGNEKTMLDSNVVIDNLGGKDAALFAVFDGHQEKCEVEDNFTTRKLEEYNVNQSIFQEHLNNHKDSVSHFLSENLEKIFDQSLRKGGDQIEALKLSFEELEDSLRLQKNINFENDGASGSVVLLEKINDDRYVSLASFGDCLVFLVKSTKNKARLISDLHSVHNDLEIQILLKNMSEEEKKSDLFQEFLKEKIITSGFGFLKYKKFMRKLPYTSKIKLEDDDSMLIIASKGIWSNIPGQEIPNILNSQINSQQMSDDLVRIAKQRG